MQKTWFTSYASSRARLVNYILELFVHNDWDSVLQKYINDTSYWIMHVFLNVFQTMKYKNNNSNKMSSSNEIYIILAQQKW